MTTEEIMQFKSGREFERWLSRNSSKSTGIWLRRFKKGYRGACVSGADALDVALCYGWITGQARPYDEVSALWRFCPRRPRSLWSRLNTQHAERLIKEGRMTTRGAREIEEAKADGRWQRAYSPQSAATLPADFVMGINRNKKAKAFLKTLNRSNVYAIIFRLETAKDGQKRKERIASIIEMLEHGKKLR